MTPLAHKMIRQLLLPSKSRFRDITLKEMTGHHDERGAAGLQQRFLEIAQLACVASFFDVTALCGEIGERGGLIDRRWQGLSRPCTAGAHPGGGSQGSSAAGGSTRQADLRSRVSHGEGNRLVA
jgi:hypothetical protein